jgi:hypothetical protein
MDGLIKRFNLRVIGSVLCLVAAAILVPLVFIGGFAVPIFTSLFSSTSSGSGWLTPFTVWSVGAIVIGALSFVGVRGIVRSDPSPPRPDGEPSRP